MTVWAVKLPVLAVANVRVEADTDEEAIAKATEMLEAGECDLTDPAPMGEVVIDGRTIAPMAFPDGDALPGERSAHPSEEMTDDDL